MIKIVFFETLSLWDTLKTVIFLKTSSCFFGVPTIGQLLVAIRNHGSNFCFFYSTLLYTPAWRIFVSRVRVLSAINCAYLIILKSRFLPALDYIDCSLHRNKQRQTYKTVV